jgi:hypothetical protein
LFQAARNFAVARKMHLSSISSERGLTALTPNNTQVRLVVAEAIAPTTTDRVQLLEPGRTTRAPP